MAESAVTTANVAANPRRKRANAPSKICGVGNEAGVTEHRSDTMNMLTKITADIAKVSPSLRLAGMPFAALIERDQLGEYMGKVRGSVTSFAAAAALVAMTREEMVAYVANDMEQDLDGALRTSDCLRDHCEALRLHLNIAEAANARYVVALTEAADLSFEDTFPDDEWDVALAEYEAAHALWDKLGEDYSDEESDAVHAIWSPAFDKLADTPAPDNAALALKIDIMTRDRRTPNEDDMAAILADARRLAGMEA